jgi:preprotein translocase subunit YajC
MRQYQTLIMIALMVVAFYFLIMRPQRKRQQAVQRTMNELAPGTRVLLNSGIFGTVLAVGERQAQIELAPGVELTVLKQAIARVATEADEDTFDDGEDDDDLEEAYEKPDGVEPVGPSERTEPESKPSTVLEDPDADTYRPSSTYAGPDVEPGPEQQRPSSN